MVYRYEPAPSELLQESAEQALQCLGLSDLRINNRGQWVAWDDNQADFVRVTPLASSQGLDSQEEYGQQFNL